MALNDAPTLESVLEIISVKREIHLEYSNDSPEHETSFTLLFLIGLVSYGELSMIQNLAKSNKIIIITTHIGTNSDWLSGF